MKTTPATSKFAALVQGYFSQRLVEQQNASVRTVASYRDTFRLLLGYLQTTRKRAVAALTLADLDAPVIAAFLDHLERRRHNGIRTRNARFAAIRSFLRCAASREPESLPVVQRVLAMPMKRFARPALTFLSREEMSALLEAPDDSTWSGQRDRALFALMYNTGARVSEAIAVRRADLSLDATRSVRIMGKGRKERTVPLWKGTARQLSDWAARISMAPEALLFPSRGGGQLSRSGVEKRLQHAVAVAVGRCPTLSGKRVSPHTLRHTTAMHLLQAGVDITVISLWLGHESTETTHQYVEANLVMKEEALAKLEEIAIPDVRYRASDELLRFLDGL